MILVTGCAGFIGSNLCKLLLERGYEVIGMDNLITGNINNLAVTKTHSRFTFIEHDVTQFIDIKGELDKDQKDILLHQHEIKHKDVIDTPDKSPRENITRTKITAGKRQ